MSAFFSHPIVRGALSGAVAAAAVDYRAFLAFRSLDDLARYDWRVAAFRWAQGAIAGALAAAGLGLV